MQHNFSKILTGTGRKDQINVSCLDWPKSLCEACVCTQKTIDIEITDKAIHFLGFWAQDSQDYL